MSNSWKGLGRLGGDPEVRHVNGKDGQAAVVNFSIAVPNRKGTTPETNWFRCEAWGKSGELIAKHLRKGSLIDVADAEIRTDEWDDKTTGEKRSELKFRINRFDFVPFNSPPGREDEGDGTEEASDTAPEKAEEASRPEPARRRAATAGAGSRGRRAATPAIDEDEDDPEIKF